MMRPMGADLTSSFPIDPVADCDLVEGSRRISQEYSSHLTDESKATGEVPERIYFPGSTEQVAQVMRRAAELRESVTVSGARTGIVGGAVPGAGSLLSLQKLRSRPVIRLDEESGLQVLRVLAGNTLAEMHEAIRSDPTCSDRPDASQLYYPVDPTETSASAGGTVATNASGARTLLYGPTRDWVQGLRVVLPNGEILQLHRGEVCAGPGGFRLRSPGGNSSAIPIAPLPLPRTKNTAGYFLQDGMDAVDLFIGGEGTLGIVTEIEVKLTERPPHVLCLVIYLPADEPVGIVAALRALGPSALEYMDKGSIALLGESRRANPGGSHVPEFPAGTSAALYVEFGASEEERIEQLCVDIEGILDRCDASMDSTWAGFTPGDIESMKKFRHALPERVNTKIAERKRLVPELAKIGTDMAVPNESLGEMLALYRKSLDAEHLEYCIFGHIGNAHLHVNILPQTVQERDRGKALYREFATAAVGHGGSVSGEHGIGRLKRDFLRIQFSDEHIDIMKRLKRALDPDLILNPGVLFDSW